MSHIHHLLVIAIVSLCALDLRADIIVITHTRTVWAANDKGCTQSNSVTGNDMAPFTASAGVSWAGTCGQYLAAGHQDSVISPDFLNIKGSANDLCPMTTDAGIQQRAESLFSETFMLTSTGALNLAGVLDCTNDMRGTNCGCYDAWVRLSRQGDQIFSACMLDLAPAGGTPSQRLLDSVIELTPGAYQLEVGASAGCCYEGSARQPGTGGGGSANYDISFTIVPEPATLLILACGAIALRLRKR
jgi:hypothetical protein